MPFTNSGERKPEGPGPLPEGFMHAPDIEGLPWTRRHGDEWTTPEFRQLVFDWIIGFFDSRDWPIKWDVTEKATATRSINRLDESKVYLIIGVTRKSDNERFEVAVAFRENEREDNPQAVTTVLDGGGEALDAQHAASS
jgi:hypothetical protein